MCTYLNGKLSAFTGQIPPELDIVERPEKKVKKKSPKAPPKNEVTGSSRYEQMVSDGPVPSFFSPYSGQREPIRFTGPDWMNRKMMPDGHQENRKNAKGRHLIKARKLVSVCAI